MFDLNDYYNYQNNSYIDDDSEESIILFLQCQIRNIVVLFNKHLNLKDDYCLNELNDNIKIVLDIEKVKESPYNSKVKKENILKALSKKTDPLSKHYYERLKDWKPDYDEDEYKNILRRYLSDVNESNSDDEDGTILIIKKYLSNRIVTGEFIENKNTIILYLKAICMTKGDMTKNLRKTFAHELFHAYHYFHNGMKFKSTWKYNNYQYSTVKEGLATFFELLYCHNFNINIMHEEDDLRYSDMRYDPYASKNLIDSEVAYQLFHTPDIGDAYNLLVELYRMAYCNRIKTRYFE